jgi:hypothetical protein
MARDHDSPGPALSRVDTTTPHPARRYDYLLGGQANYAADRAAADEIVARHPTARLSVWENRWFLHRAVRFLAARGIRQFLDIGTGIPTSPNTDEIAQQADPTSRVVYVDNDPLVLVHARALLSGDARGRTAYLEADLRDPRKILEDPQLRETLDLSRPTGLLLIAVLHFIRDPDQPREILGMLIDALAPGSYLVASHATPEYMPPEQAAALRAVMESQWADRSGAELAALFDHPRLEPVAPGVQSVSRWWTEDAPDPRLPVEDVASNGIVLRVRG